MRQTLADSEIAVHQRREKNGSILGRLVAHLHCCRRIKAERTLLRYRDTIERARCDIRHELVGSNSAPSLHEPDACAPPFQYWQVEPEP